MKTNIKLELGLLGFATLLSLIFQVHVRTTSNTMKKEEITLSKSLLTSQIDIADYTQIKNRIDIPVELYTGPNKAEITTDPQLLEALDITTEDGQLIVDYKSGNNKRGNQELNNASLIKIYSPSALNAVELHHNAKVAIKNVTIDSIFSVGLDGNSRFHGELNVKELKIETAGNAYLELSGSTNNLSIESSGNSQVIVEEMQCQNAEIESEGNSSGSVFSTTTLDAHLSGNSQFSIIGNPDKMKVIESGNSRINIKE